MSKLALAAAILWGSSFAAFAAELPSRDHKSEPPAPAKSCEFQGKKGVLSPDGQTCLIVGGYISVQGAYAPH